MKYWNINQILPYQRCFNLINGERSIGKTYTTLKFVVNRALHRGQEFVYIVRTQDEKKRGVMEKALNKVLQHEFKNEKFAFTQEEAYRLIEDEDGNVEEKTVIGYCIALSEAIKIKKQSFPNVKYLVFDEYMLEEKQSSSYVNGWKEPDLFLNIYHTIDREEDRVICFLLGNNTSFYNPYHMHKAFDIPPVKKGGLWYSENVLFQWAVGSDELKEDKNKCKFLKMIAKTEYGTYAKEGDYVNDSYDFVETMTCDVRHMFNIEYQCVTYGIWVDNGIGRVYVSLKYDPSCKLTYALTIDDHTENTLLTRNKNNTTLQWLAKNFKLGNVRFESMVVKVRTENAIKLLL